MYEQQKEEFQRKMLRKEYSEQIVWIVWIGLMLFSLSLEDKYY